MAVNPMIEYFSRDLIPEYCHGINSNKVYTAAPFFVESIPGRSNRSLPHLPLHFAFIGNHSYIPKVQQLYRTMTSQSPNPDTTRVVQNVLRVANCQNQQNREPWGIHNFPLLRDAFPYHMARAIPLKQGVP